MPERVQHEPASRYQPFADKEEDRKRKAEIEEMMRSQREFYFRNEPVQQEYRDIVDRQMAAQQADVEAATTPGPFDEALARFRGAKLTAGNPPQADVAGSSYLFEAGKRKQGRPSGATMRSLIMGPRHCRMQVSASETGCRYPRRSCRNRHRLSIRGVTASGAAVRTTPPVSRPRGKTILSRRLRSIRRCVSTAKTVSRNCNATTPKGRLQSSRALRIK
jgi:hypothetical protein